MRLKNVDACNRIAIKNAIGILNKKDGESWFLCQAVDNVKKTDALPKPEERSGLIVWNDKNGVTSYSSYLAQTTRLQMERESKYTWSWVHRASSSKWCTGVKAMHRTKISVPVIVAAYILFMNGVYV